MKVAIAGAGLTGRLAAWALSRAGHSVEVFDPAPGPLPVFDGHGAAAFTAAGMLSPLAELDKAEPEVAALGWQSLRLWPGIAAQLPGPVSVQTQGSLLLAHRQDAGSAERVLMRLREAGPAFPTPQALDAAQLRELEPSLIPSGLRAWLLAGEGLIDPVQAMAGLHAGAVGVRWHWAQSVSQLQPGALTLSDGRHIKADLVLDARGLGARPELAAAPGRSQAAAIPLGGASARAQPWGLDHLRGVRGEVVALDAPGHGLRRPIRLLHPRHRIYLVPRSAREILIGASEIESEDRSPVSLQSAVELMAAAHSVMPALSEARITRLDRNLRPALPDNRPLLHREPGLLRINGLYRHGWLLAPALMQQLLADWVTLESV